MADASVITDDEFRARNADINTLGKGILWGLMCIFPPAFFYCFSRRVYPSISPVVAAIVGTILAIIPGLNLILGIAILVLAYKRIGMNFILGEIILYVVFVLIAIGLVLAVPSLVNRAASESAVSAPAPAPAAPAAPEAPAEPATPAAPEGAAPGSEPAAAPEKPAAEE